jgi:hypothetical protein
MIIKLIEDFLRIKKSRDECLLELTIKPDDSILRAKLAKLDGEMKFSRSRLNNTVNSNRLATEILNHFLGRA